MKKLLALVVFGLMISTGAVAGETRTFDWDQLKAADGRPRVRYAPGMTIFWCEANQSPTTCVAGTEPPRGMRTISVITTDLRNWVAQDSIEQYIPRLKMIIGDGRKTCAGVVVDPGDYKLCQE